MNALDLHRHRLPRRRGERGQTLLLWALSLLVLALMVTMVLSVGTRVREKIETQTLADTAAYSNAVATARTFNIVSLMNRTQISHMVAQAGVQSLISWSANYLSALSAAHWDLTVNFMDMPCGDIFCICGDYARAMLLIQSISMWIAEYQAFGLFTSMEPAAAEQAKSRWYAAMSLYGLENESYYMDLRGNMLGTSGLPSRVLRSARPATVNNGAELTANVPNGDSVTMRETGTSIGCLTGGGVVCNPPVDSEHAVEAAMGSRGYPFVTARMNTDYIITARLNEIMMSFPTPGVESIATSELNMGSGYFSPFDLTWWHGLPPALGTYSQADDHSLVSVASIGPWCGTTSPPYPTLSWLKSGNFIFGTSSHIYLLNPTIASLSGYLLYPGNVPIPPVPWTPFPGPPIPANEPQAATIHRVSDLPWFGIWPLFLDYSWGKVANDQDNFGQPKNMAVIQRDYAARAQPDPFNLFFRFRFQQGSQHDNRGIQLSTAPYTDISKMTAMSTGITYYHRGGHWKEPPNFLSPFWRATLVAADTDQQGRGANADEASLMGGANQPEAAALWNALQMQGFKGVH